MRCVEVRLEVADAQVAPGEVFTVRGSGFACDDAGRPGRDSTGPDEDVRLEVTDRDGTSTTIGTVDADETGSFVATLTVPGGTPEGQLTVSAYGQSGEVASLVSVSAGAPTNTTVVPPLGDAAPVTTAREREVGGGADWVVVILLLFVAVAILYAVARLSRGVRRAMR